MAFAKAQVGDPYLWGGGHAYGDFRAWDCSGFATNVAGTSPASPAASARPTASPASPANGGEPVVFGFRPGHMGIRLDGDLVRRGLGWRRGRRRALVEPKVPPGLQYLSGLIPREPPRRRRGPDPGPRQRPDRRTPIQKVTGLIKKTGAFGGRRARRPGEVDRARRAGSLERRPAELHRRPGARDLGRRARGPHAARAAGKSPEQVPRPARTPSARPRQDPQALRRLAKKDMRDALEAARPSCSRTSRSSAATRPRTPPGARAKQKLMAQIRAKLADLTEEINEVREEIAEIKERLAEICEEVAAEAYEDAYDAAQAAAEAAPTRADCRRDAAPAGPTADQQAASRPGQGARPGGPARPADLRLLPAHALRLGDHRPGRRLGTVNINTLHPGDPAIQGEVATWVVGALGGQGSVPRSAYGLGSDDPQPHAQRRLGADAGQRRRQHRLRPAAGRQLGHAHLGAQLLGRPRHPGRAALPGQPAQPHRRPAAAGDRHHQGRPHLQAVGPGEQRRPAAPLSAASAA